MLSTLTDMIIWADMYVEMQRAVQPGHKRPVLDASKRMRNDGTDADFA